MTDILLSPNLLFLPVETWNDENERDTALDRLLGFLDEIERLKIVRVLWSVEFEGLLWTDPALPPWRIDRDWNLPLVPVIAKKFRQWTTYIETDGQCDCSAFVPSGSVPVVRTDIAEAFCRLAHQAASEKRELALCQEEVPGGQIPFAFKCGPFEIDTTVRTMISPRSLRANDQVSSEFWKSAQVRTAIDVDFLLRFAVESMERTPSVLYSLSCSNSFLKELGAAPNKQEIFEAMARRVSQNVSDASHDKCLNDEPVKGQDGIRRFRVTKAQRIHYEYPEKGKLLFRNYYSESEHNVGL